jgi:acetyl-CoA carboxylase carboxyltransferase component
MMVGPKPEATGLVRHTSRMLVTAAALRVPFVGVILRRGYGLGAQAMAACTSRCSRSRGRARISVLWGSRARSGSASAARSASVFELDDVVDPAETRGLIAATLAAAAPSTGRGHRFVDTW